MTKLRTAVGYIRVSTTGQADNGDSLDDQRARVEGYCKAHQLKLVEVIEDAGVTASHLDRPGATRALALVRDRKVDALVVTKIDRLTRSSRDLCDIIELVEKTGIQLCSVGEAIDTKTAAGRLTLQMMGVVAQWHRENIAERTKEVLGHKRAKGEKVSRFAPYGFRDDGQGNWVPDKREQRGVRMMHDLRAAGHSLRDIGSILYRKGIKARNGKPLSPPVIMRALKRAPVD